MEKSVAGELVIVISKKQLDHGKKVNNLKFLSLVPLTLLDYVWYSTSKEHNRKKPGKFPFFLLGVAHTPAGSINPRHQASQRYFSFPLLPAITFSSKNGGARTRLNLIISITKTIIRS